MSKIITEIVKQENDPWILIEKNIIDAGQIFTQEEFDTVIRPFLAFVRELPGYDYFSQETVIEGNQATITMVFDTIADMLTAKDRLFSANTTDIEVINKNLLLRNKMQSANVTYNIRILTQ